MLKIMCKMKILSGIAALLALAVVLVSPVTVQAAASVVPDESMTGTVQITLKDMDSGEAVPGGSIIARKVGAIVENEGEYSYVLVEELEDSGISLEDVTRTDLASELADYIAENKINLTTAEAAVAKDGFVAFSELSIGLWLFENKEPAAGYEKFSPFVVTVPSYDEKQNAYIYEIDATPKVAVKKTVTPPPPSITVTPSTATPSTATPTPSTATPTPKPVLPQTGQLWWPVPVLAIAGAAFVLFGWIRRRSR